MFYLIIHNYTVENPTEKNPIIVQWTSFMTMWPASLLSSCQEWHHVGCRGRLRPGGHDGRGAPCGGAAPQANGQPVEQSAVLNLHTPSGLLHLILQKHPQLQPQRNVSCVHRLLWQIHITMYFSFSSPQGFSVRRRSGHISVHLLKCLCWERKPTIRNQCYRHLMVLMSSPTYRSFSGLMCFSGLDLFNTKYSQFLRKLCIHMCLFSF